MRSYPLREEEIPVYSRHVLQSRCRRAGYLMYYQTPFNQSIQSLPRVSPDCAEGTSACLWEDSAIFLLVASAASVMSALLPGGDIVPLVSEDAAAHGRACGTFPVSL